MTAAPDAGADILGDMPARVSATVMVGRQEPLQVLAAGLAASRDGSGRVALVGRVETASVARGLAL
jgi:hypothetical protein